MTKLRECSAPPDCAELTVCDACELSDWREMFCALMEQGLDRLDPSFRPTPLWPNSWCQDVAFVAKLLHEYEQICSTPGNLVEVGEAGHMPGTSGFTMGCFEAAKVPLGTRLYAAAPCDESCRYTVTEAGRKAVGGGS